jgi:SNF family Na+-dependent transporter
MTNSYQNQLAEDRFGLLVAARLSDAADELPYDISERLRAARTRALANRKIAVTRTATSTAVSGGVATITFGNEHLNWWDRIAAVIPLLALVLGLIAISAIQNDNRTNELAEIDSALLTDDLPPAAYTDAGFAHFIKLNSAENQ